MGVASINRVGARVCFTIGARGDLYRFEVDDDRFDIREIGQAIVETEAELVCAFAEAYHPQRIPFLQWLPVGGMNNGDTVPAHIGQIEAVRVTASNESESELEDDDWMLAEKTTAANIKLWRENHNSIFEDTDGYYELTNQTLEFTGGVAQVKIVSYEPLYAELADESESEGEGTVIVVRTIADVNWVGTTVSADPGTGNFTAADIGRSIRYASNGVLIGTIIAILNVDEVTVDQTTAEPQANVDIEVYELIGEYVGELQISDIWEPCLHAGAIARLAKLGVPAALVQQYTSEFARCLARIRQGMTSKAEIDQEQMAK